MMPALVSSLQCDLQHPDSHEKVTFNSTPLPRWRPASVWLLHHAHWAHRLFFNGPVNRKLA